MYFKTQILRLLGARIIPINLPLNDETTLAVPILDHPQDPSLLLHAQRFY